MAIPSSHPEPDREPSQAAPQGRGPGEHPEPPARSAVPRQSRWDAAAPGGPDHRVAAVIIPRSRKGETGNGHIR